MSSLVKFPIDQAFRFRLQRIGFDIDIPDRRFRTHNDFPQKILNLKRRNTDQKAQPLLKDRTTSGRDGRARMIPWLATGIAGVSLPDPAFAHDHHPSLLEIVPRSLPETPAPWFAELMQFDFSDPLWGLSLGAALLLTQTMAVFQRRALLKSRICQSTAFPEPGAFPETNAVESQSHEPAQISPTWKWSIDAHTRTGRVRSENQDALAVLRHAEDRAVLVVCDGAGGVGGGREASQSAKAAIEKHLQQITGSVGISDLEDAIAAARCRSQDKDLEGVTTALVAALDGNIMHYATLGDGALVVIWPDGMIGQVQIPHHTAGQPSNVIDAYIGGNCTVAPRVGSLRLEAGCLVMVMSDGVSDLLTFEDFANRRNELTDITGMSSAVVQQLEDARDPDTGGFLHSDNMTLALARLEGFQ